PRHQHTARPGGPALPHPRAAGAVVPDHRRGEAEDLPVVGGVRDRLLVAGHPGGEDHLAERRARRGDGATLEDQPVRQRDDRAGGAMTDIASSSRALSRRALLVGSRHRTSLEMALNSGLTASSSISKRAISTLVTRAPARSTFSSPSVRFTGEREATASAATCTS